MDDFARVQVAEMKQLIPVVAMLGSASSEMSGDRLVRKRWCDYVVNRDVAADHATRPQDVARRLMSTFDPVLMAAFVGMAWPIVVSEEPSAAWATFLERSAEDGPLRPLRLASASKRLKGSTRHYESFAQASGPIRYGISRALDGRGRGPRPLAPYPNVCGQNVPGVMWSGAAEFLADGMLEGFRLSALRRFLSLALARTVEPALVSWDGAAELLGLPVSSSCYAKRLSAHVRAIGCGGEFSRRLDVVASALAVVSDPIDYGHRRAALRGLTDIHSRRWGAMCHSLGVDPRSEIWTHRRFFGSAWLWATLTGGDWRYSPSLRRFQQRVPAGQQIINGDFEDRFVAVWVPRLRRELMDAASTVLHDKGLPGPVSQTLNVPELATP